MTEKDLIEDILSSEKQLISSYSSGITESSCKNLRNVLVNNLKCSEETQYRAFDTMKQKGWYPTKDAQDNEVQKVKDDVYNLSKNIK
ncbi:spore coat protein F [Clostridium acetobutylicum]|nr:spore coat protein F [Clostridium acetobutylicum]